MMSIKDRVNPENWEDVEPRRALLKQKFNALSKNEKKRILEDVDTQFPLPDESEARFDEEVESVLDQRTEWMLARIVDENTVDASAQEMVKHINVSSAFWRDFKPATRAALRRAGFYVEKPF